MCRKTARGDEAYSHYSNLHWIISWRSITSQIIHCNLTWPLLNKFYCMISQFPISGFIHSSCYLLTKCRGRRRPCPLLFWLHWPFSDCCQATVSDSLFYLRGGRDFSGIIFPDSHGASQDTMSITIIPNPTISCTNMKEMVWACLNILDEFQ